jgi:chemotaxis protein MotB
LRYLRSQGIPADQIRAVACGESRPIDTNSTATGKARNRRVEIVVRMKP